MSLRFVSAAACAALLLSVTFALRTRLIAQTREDSVGVARLIIVRALSDAQRRRKDIRSLSWVQTLRSSRETAVQGSDRLLELGMDSALVRAAIPPVCPWELVGPVEPRLQLTLGVTQIFRTEARADVMLSCRGRERGASRWDYYCMIARKGAHWVITGVSLRGET